MIGWIAWTAGKHAAKYAAKDAAKSAKPSIHPKPKKPNKSAILVGVAAAVGALAYLKSRARSKDDALPDVEIEQPAICPTRRPLCLTPQVSDTSSLV